MRHVLVVEDSKEIRELIADVCEGVADQVDMACNGLDAISFIKTSKGQTVNCILTDLSMPLCDGFELLERLQKVERKVLTIILTAHDTAEFIERAKQLGVSAFVDKGEWRDIPNIVDDLYNENGY